MGSWGRCGAAGGRGVLSQFRTCGAGAGGRQRAARCCSHLAFAPTWASPGWASSQSILGLGFSRGFAPTKWPQVLVHATRVSVGWARRWRFVPRALRASPVSGELCPRLQNLGKDAFSPSFYPSELFKLPVLWDRNFSSIRHPACVGYYLGMLL